MTINQHQQHHLALFARFPSPGTCKTRLIPRLGEEGACAFASAALTDLMHYYAGLPAQKTLFYTPAAARSQAMNFLACESLQSSWAIQPQVSGGDLGARLSAALKHFQTLSLQSQDPSSTSSSTDSVVTFIGMDCFDLTLSHVEHSMSVVQSTAGTAHMFPARDGGYVLLTVPLTCADSDVDVFERIPWSCNQTARVQIERLEESDLSCVVGPELDDVDDPPDLDRLWEAREEKLDAYPRTRRYLETVML